MLRGDTAIGAITVVRREAMPFTDNADRAAEDLRRPSRHRHREHAAVRGGAGAQARAAQSRSNIRPRQRSARRHLVAQVSIAARARHDCRSAQSTLRCRRRAIVRARGRDDRCARRTSGDRDRSRKLDSSHRHGRTGPRRSASLERQTVARCRTSAERREQSRCVTPVLEAGFARVARRPAARSEGQPSARSSLLHDGARASSPRARSQLDADLRRPSR